MAETTCYPLFQHKICGSHFEEIHGGILADRPSHDDGRNVRADFLGHHDGLATVEVRQLVVDENQIWLVVREGRPELLASLDPLPDKVQSRFPKFPDLQFRIKVGILKQQDPKGLFFNFHELV